MKPKNASLFLVSELSHILGFSVTGIQGNLIEWASEYFTIHVVTDKKIIEIIDWDDSDLLYWAIQGIAYNYGYKTEDLHS